jgi:hypothetical protein
MNKIVTFSLAAVIMSASLFAQTQITNGGFENWGNASPGVSSEPTSWYSNKSGSNIAQLGPQTCFETTTTVHTGTAAVSVTTESLNLGFETEVVNGNVTTGVVNAPTTTKSDGYIGTVNYSTSSDDRRMAFTGRPDSIVGWYQYTSGGAGEQPKVRAILHIADYYDPETPTTYHPDPTANKIADALFVGGTSNVTTWTRFSEPFTYVSTSNPAYIMINITSSDNQNTTVSGSTFILDDIAVVYNSSAGINEINKNESVRLFFYDKTFYVDFMNRHEGQSTLNIYDVTGKLVLSQNVDNNRINSINLSTLNAGMYVYNLSGDSYQKAGKFIVD